MKKYSILVANYHLDTFGGSETFTYTLAKELKRRNFYVNYFTFKKGDTSRHIERLGIEFMSRSKYDLILANHNTCVNYLYNYGPIIQTCHGIYPKLESPSPLADCHVAISFEVHEHLKTLKKNSTIILNGIDLTRYKCKKVISPKIKTILSLVQSDKANEKIESACKQLNINFFHLDKNQNPIWNIEDLINNADLVIGLGRSVYEAIACGRAVIIYDERPYAGSYADGYLTADTIDLFISKNCSGRFRKLKLTTEELSQEIRKYKHADGERLRKKAESLLDIQKKVDEYLKLAKKLENKKKNQPQGFISYI